jgi:enterochelin esterase-like enzyme
LVNNQTQNTMKTQITLLTFAVFSLSALAADVTGTWKAEFDTQRGLQKYTFNLKQDGANVTGKASVEMTDQKREAEFKEGKVDGDTVTFVEILNAQGSDLSISYIGKISVNEIKFTRKVGDFGSSEASAKREAAIASAQTTATQPATAQPGTAQPGPANPGARGGRGGAITLGPDDKQAFPDAPAGFNAARDNVPHGEIKLVEYDSKTLGTRRTMGVYTPPGYTTDKKYPVLYMQHGLGNTHTEWTQRARAPQIVDNLLADGKIQPLIMIFPSGDATATVDKPEGGGRAQAGYGELFTQDFLKDIIPFVESHYSVLPDRDHRAIGGMSMGSGQTLNIGLSHVDMFAWVGAIAPAPNTKPPAELVPDPAVAKNLKLLWLACGSKDGLLRVAQGVHSYLKEKSVPHIWNVDGNGHDTAEMGNNFYHYVQHIFKE